MASNVFTKNEILQNLANKGFFIDAYTLDTFFEKWKVEAIFEDEQGSEFYDKNALDLVLNNLFNSSSDDKKEEKEEEPRLLQPQTPKVEQIQPQIQAMVQPQIQSQMTQNQYVHQQNTYEMQPQPMIQNNIPINMNQNINDPEANQLLNSISLSDGTPLMNKIQNGPMNEYMNYQMLEQEAIADIQPKEEPIVELGIEKEKKMGILEGAMLATGQEYEPEQSTQENETTTDDSPDFDDMSLLSESLEAQEKFREYVMSELSKKNVDLTPKNNEFKLDISERTLNMIARSMAKKIVKHVSQLYGGDPKTSEKLEEIQTQYKKLESRARELEDQNKKLRLLLTENKTYLASYKPTFFGLYKKVPPGQ